jgi:hypothetical protein
MKDISTMGVRFADLSEGADMRFVDRDLVRRLERAWTWLGVECARAFARRHPDAEVAVEPVAGGYAVFLGVGSALSPTRSPDRMATGY